jgi:hypothetical protein
MYPSLTARVLSSLRFRWKLALCGLLLGGTGFFFASRYLARCFQSSVVIGFPVVGGSESKAVLSSVDQGPAVEGLVQRYEPEPVAISHLGTWGRRASLRAQLSFEPIETTVPNSVALRIVAKEKTPEAANALAIAVGQAVLDQAESRLMPTHSPAASTSSAQPAPPPSTSTPSSSPPPAAAPVTAPDPSSPPPLRKTVTWKAAPESAEVAATRRQLRDQLVQEQDRKSRLQDDLAALNAMPKIQVPHPASSPSNEAALKSQLNTANNSLINLENRYTNLHPDVIAAKRRVADLQSALEEAIVKNAAIAKQDAANQSKVAEAQARLTRESTLQRQIAQLDAQIARDTAELDKLGQGKKTWIQVIHYSPAEPPVASQPAGSPRPVPAAAATPAPAPVSSPAPAPRPGAALQPDEQPVTLTATSPVPAMFLAQPVLGALSLLFGLLLAAVMVWLAELLSRSVKDAESLEAELPYGVHYLGEIPRMTP